ncbi:MAG TPA: MFS transporter [Yaniella sp.]
MSAPAAKVQVDTPEEQSERTPRHAALASWVGSALEYYDFAVYGTAAALVLNTLFFPEETSAGVSVLLTMGTVGVAYIVRPFGALIMGPLADRLGRRFVLMLTLFMMGGATFAIGFLPTYAQVGMWAPALLVLCRMIQGLSAAGEQASAIAVSLEHSDEHRRSLTTSWTLHGTQAGTLLATGIFIPLTVFLTDEQLYSWGWRIPFWISAVVVVVAWLIRRHLEEPPSFEESKKEIVAISPLQQTLRFHWRSVLRVTICALINITNIYMTVWAISFATNGHGLDRATMLWVPVLANLMALLLIPVAGNLADRFGRKKVFIAGSLGSALFVYPYLYFIAEGNIVALFICGVLMSGAMYSAANAVWPAFYAEQFPTRVRATGLALGTQIGFALSGGLIPVIATLLAGDNQTNWFPPAVFATVVCVIVAITALTAKETYTATLDDINDMHTTDTERAALAGRL